MVIPHKNIVDLLKRCLNSIPVRDDLHILIVDDCSLPEVREQVLALQNERITIITNDEPKGVGNARNVGINYLRDIGWTGYLVFADADDFLDENTNQCFENYKNADFDMVFFRVRGADSDTLEPKNNATYVDDKVVEAINTGNNDMLRYNVGPLWARFIKFSIVTDNKLQFPEIEILEDAVFATYLGCLASSIEASNFYLYVYTIRAGSLVMTGTDKNILQRYNAAKFITEYHKKRENKTGYELTQYNVIWHWQNVFQKSTWQGIKLLPDLFRISKKKDILNVIFKVAIKRKIKKYFKK